MTKFFFMWKNYLKFTCTMVFSLGPAGNNIVESNIDYEVNGEVQNVYICFG